MANSKCADVMRTFCYVFQDPNEKSGAYVLIAENYQTSRDKEKVVAWVAKVCARVKSTHGKFTIYKSHLPFIAEVNVGNITPEFAMVLDCDDNTYQYHLGEDIPEHTIQTC
jgi:hypothetical protein